MRRLLPLIVLLMSGPAAAAPASVEARIVDCYDGDTCAAEIEPWFDLTIRVSVRLVGIDTAELASRCPTATQRERETRLARAQRDALRALVAGRIVTLTEIRRDKYAGRVDARLWLNGVEVSRAMLAAGHGRAYDGGKRSDWCY